MEIGQTKYNRDKKELTISCTMRMADRIITEANRSYDLDRPEIVRDKD